MLRLDHRVLGLALVLAVAAGGCRCSDSGGSAEPPPARAQPRVEKADAGGSAAAGLRPGAGGLAAGPAAAAADLFQVPLGDAPTAGPADAPVTAVLFGDLSDAATASVFAQLRSLRRRVPQRLRWAFKHAPLVRPGDTGLAAALVGTLAADRGRFADFAGRLLDAPGPIDRQRLQEVGRAVGLESAAVERALADAQRKRRVAADRRLAARVGVRRPPALFVNGRRIVLGDHAGAQLDWQSILDRAQDRAERLLAAGVPADALYAALIRDGRSSAWFKIRQPRHPERLQQARQRRQRRQQRTLLVDIGPGPHLGPATAPVELVMFSQLTCSFCARMLPVLQRLHHRFGDRLRIGVRLLPDPRGREAWLNAAVVLQAAADRPGWWRLAGRLMGQRPAADEKQLLDRATEAGLDTAPLRRALRRPADWLTALEANQRAARQLEVRGSPYLFVAGRPVPGATSYERLERMIAAALEQQD